MPREGTAAEGHDVDACHLVLQPLGVAHEGGHVREDPVREADGLRGLCLFLVGGVGGWVEWLMGQAVVWALGSSRLEHCFA